MKQKTNYANLKIWRKENAVFAELTEGNYPIELREHTHRTLARHLARVWVRTGQIEPDQEETAVKRFSRQTKDILITMYKNELVLHPEITRVTWRKINPETTIENIDIIDRRSYYSKNNEPIEICVCTAEKPEDIQFDEDNE